MVGGPKEVGKSQHPSIYQLDSLGMEKMSGRCHYVSHPRPDPGHRPRASCRVHLPGRNGADCSDRGAVTESNALKPRAENAGSKPLLELQNRNASWLCSPLTNLSSL